MSRNVDYAALSRRHKAKHLTELNEQRNKLCSIADRGRSNSKRSRKTAEEYLKQAITQGRGRTSPERRCIRRPYENLLIMTDREHKQLHMALAMDQMEGGNGDEKK